MARPILLSNGSLHVGINLYGMVHDFYYPYVGLENHATANNMRHRIGVWVEGNYSCLDDGNWQFDINFEPHAMIGLTKARNEKLGIVLEMQDAVDCSEDAFLRNIHIINEFNREREVRLFLHQVFLISNSLTGDTAQYLPDEPAILHYKGRRAFMVGAADAQGKPFDQFSIGVFGAEGKEGTYRDAEDGLLAGNAVEHGNADSVIGFDMPLEPHGSHRIAYWIAAGRSQPEAMDLHHKIKHMGVHARMLATQSHWENWLSTAEPFIAKLETHLQDPVRKSLLLIKASIDKRGAVIASTDTTMRNYSRDTYAYCWPRDSAYALWPLLRLGYTEELKNYFRFCRDALHPTGYLMHKYRPDGALGSSWHPYIYAGRPTPPIQEDETAITIFLFGQYYQITHDAQLLHEYYDSLIKPAANFMAECIDEVTKLPHATYDLWEQKFLTTTYTTGTVYAGLLAAAHLAEVMNQQEDAVQWQTVADDIRAAAQTTLFNPDKQYFYNGFIRDTQRGEESHLIYDDTIDMSSFYGAFMFGLFDLDSPQITNSYQTLQKVLHVSQATVTPIVRYENDQYYTADAAGLGNPWFITTLWHAQYLMEIDKTEPAKAIINWVAETMLPSGVLSEQINPFTHKFLSVAPLTWSQAEFVNSILDLTSDPMQAIQAAEEPSHE